MKGISSYLTTTDLPENWCRQSHPCVDVEAKFSDERRTVSDVPVGLTITRNTHRNTTAAQSTMTLNQNIGYIFSANVTLESSARMGVITGPARKQASQPQPISPPPQSPS